MRHYTCMHIHTFVFGKSSVIKITEPLQVEIQHFKTFHHIQYLSIAPPIKMQPVLGQEIPIMLMN